MASWRTSASHPVSGEQAVPRGRSASSMRSLLVLLVVGLAMAASIAAAGTLWTTSYDELVSTLLRRAGKLHRALEFKQTYLTPGAFLALRALSAAAAIASVGAAVLGWRRRQALAERAAAAVLALFAPLRPLSPWRTGQRLALVGLGVLVMALAVPRQVGNPITYDEAWTYLNFARQGPLVAASYYAAPNNHVLFSLLTTVTVRLPLPPQVGLRIPNLGVALAVVLAAYLLVSEHFGSRVGVIATAALAFSHPFSVYAVQARGYLLVVLFTIVAVHGAARAVSRQGTGSPWSLFAVSVAFGGYVMPSFLYVALALGVSLAVVLLCRRDWDGCSRLMLAGFAATGLATVLYTPILVVSGITAVAQNPFVKSIPYHEFLSRWPTFLADTAAWLAPGGVVTVLSLAALGAWASARRPPTTRAVGAMAAGLLALPPLFTGLHSVIPFTRTFVFMAPALALLLASALSMASGLVRRALPIAARPWVTAAAVLALAAVNELTFDDRYAREWAPSFLADAAVTRLVREPPGRVYSTSDLYENILIYQFTVRGMPYRGDRGSGFRPDGEYDYLLLDARAPASAPPLGGYSLVLKDPFVSVWRRRPGAKDVK